MRLKNNYTPTIMKKIFLSLLLVLLPLVAFADAVEIDGIYYKIVPKGNAAEVTINPNLYVGIVDIPASIVYEGNEYSVTSIGNYAFRYCKDLTSVTIPSSVLSIGTYAFYACEGLTSVTIPNSVTNIGEYVFSNCYGLTSVTISESVTKISDCAFSSCRALTSITIPNSVTYIGKYAFSGCSSLTTITIPNSVTVIDEYAFYFCDAMTTINLQKGIMRIGWHAFQKCSKLTSVNIPNSVVTIGAYAFAECTDLNTILIPNGVKNIGGSAFADCTSLTTVTIPNSVTEITSYTFVGCTGLTSVTIPQSVTSIGERAFHLCSSLSSIIIPNSVTLIGEDAFYGCKGLTTITIGSATRGISSRAFASCPELTDVFCLATNVPSTSDAAFQDSYIEFATLHVPTGSVNAYKEKEPGKNFKSIVALEGETPETPKCATPTISYQNGQLIFESETEGAEFVSEITDTDIKKHYDAKVSLTATYTITVYATKSGYDNSDVATAALCWIDQQPKTEGITDGLAQIPARPVLIKTDRGQINVEGVDDQTNITIFTTDGNLAGSAISQNGSASIDTRLPAGTAAIVRIGGKSVKVLVK